MVRYSLAWRNPHTQPSGPRVLHAALVTRGEKCPQEILDLWSPGCGYAVTWELVTAAYSAMEQGSKMKGAL
jgi:hypothetical protein